ncbi:MAG: helix-turn-helix domain-containing protein [Actinobacteria bacterium]|nr:helix-turn-helix domain-containing protein [Actinomycetota bacterium]
MCERIDEGRSISHVADESGVSRQRLGVWYQRWLKEGEAGLQDHSSRPLRSPNLLSDEIGDCGWASPPSSERRADRSSS